MSVGDLWSQIQWALARPGTRTPTFGRLARNPKERKEFKQIAKEEAETILMARRFDVAPELNDYVYKQIAEANYSPLKLALSVNQLRMPFKNMWFEFKSQDYPVTVACLVEQKPIKGHQDLYDYSFQFYMQYEDAMTTICETGVVISSKGAPSQWQQHMIDSVDEKNYRDIVSRVAYGIENVNEWDDALYLEGYDNLIERTQLLHKTMIAESRPETYNDWKRVSGHAQHLKFMICLINTLNFPWIQKEIIPAKQQKSKTPRVTPTDSYYRCKINLPKPNGVMARCNKPKEDSYGMRLHQVRGHWRVFRDDEGDFIKRTWIREHRRGNAKLGVVHKDYQLDYKPDPSTPRP